MPKKNKHGLLVGFLISFFLSFIGGIIVGLVWDKKGNKYWTGVIIALALEIVLAMVFISYGLFYINF